MKETAYQTRLERILGVPLAEDAARQWPQTGEIICGRARIAEVESICDYGYGKPSGSPYLEWKPI